MPQPETSGHHRDPSLVRYALWSLSLALFVLGSTSLVVVGIGPDIALDLGVSVADAGWLMTGFAGVFAISAPVFQFVLSGRASPKTIILTGILLLTVGLIWAAMAEGFASLLASRCLAALGGALIAPTSAALAVSLVPETVRGRALATVFGGFTLASVLGVPLATWLTLLLGWRGAMLALAGVAILSLLAVFFAVRKNLSQDAPPRSEAVSDMSLHRPALALLVNLLFMATQFTIYTLLAEILANVFGLPTGLLPLALLAFGVTGVLGNMAAGMVTDRIGSEAAIWISFAALAAMLLGFFVTDNALVAATLYAGCAFAGTFYLAPQQTRLTEYVKSRDHAILLALNSSSSYVGIALGTATASLLYQPVGFPGLVGAALVLLLASAIINRLGPGATRL